MCTFSFITPLCFKSIFPQKVDLTPFNVSKGENSKVLEILKFEKLHNFIKLLL